MKVDKKGKVVKEEVPAETGDVASLYKKYEQTARGRVGAAGGSSEEIRKFAATLFDTTGQDRLVLSAIIKAMAENKGTKIQNGTARSALKKVYDLAKDDQGRVWVVKKTA